MSYYVVHPDGTRTDLPEGTDIFSTQDDHDARHRDALPPPQMDMYLFIIWLVVLGILGVTLFVFGVLAFQARSDTTTATWLMAPATTALGIIAGLLSPSPATAGR